MVGVEIEGDDAVVRNNSIHDNVGNAGISVTQTAANTLIVDNALARNGTAIVANQPSNFPSGLRIEANTIQGNASNFAMSVNGAGLVINNDVVDNSTSLIGIDASGSFTEVRGNRVRGQFSSSTNLRGIRLSNGAYARENTVFGNNIGIEINVGNAIANVVHSNSIGMVVSATQNLISGNVVYGNTLAALDQNAGAESTIVNNTFINQLATESGAMVLRRARPIRSTISL